MKVEVLLYLEKKLKGDTFKVEIACDNDKDYYLTIVNNLKDSHGEMATYPFSKDELERLKGVITEILSK